MLNHTISVDGGAEAAAPGSSWTNGSCLEGSSSGGICTSSHWHYAKLWQGPDNVAIYKQYWDQYSGSLEALSKENPLMHHLLQVNVVNDEKQREVKHFLLSAFPKQLVAPGACQRGTTRRATLVNCSKVFCNSTRKLLYGYKDLQRFSLTQSKQSSFQYESLLSILQVHIYNCKIFKIELE